MGRIQEDVYLWVAVLLWPSTHRYEASSITHSHAQYYTIITVRQKEGSQRVATSLQYTVHYTHCVYLYTR